MKLRHPLWLLTMVVSAAAMAHAHLERSTPADKSHVKAPAAIELHFSEAARLTAFTLQRDKDPAHAIKPLPAQTAVDLSVAVPALAAGNYIASWRVVSEDGHVMSGKFGFTVEQ